MFSPSARFPWPKCGLRRRLKVDFNLLNNLFYFPLLVLKGIDHYWKYFFPRGLNQMEVDG